MKRKALIIGALPLPFEGPWVPISDAEAWKVTGDGDYGEGMVAIEVIEDESRPHAVLYTDAAFFPHVVRGSRVRAVILDAVPGVPYISVTAEAVRVA